MTDKDIEQKLNDIKLMFKIINKEIAVLTKCENARYIEICKGKIPNNDEDILKEVNHLNAKMRECMDEAIAEK